MAAVVFITITIFLLLGLKIDQCFFPFIKSTVVM